MNLLVRASVCMHAGRVNVIDHLLKVVRTRS
ncbi:Putative protein of unknown function [Podospora comata]|uniref:Uncharacterized protein n=1 Tax=Podospora comata TaxID=48703 RepID=A0ABY6RUK7_PODCO|nr:Putative protein of unknown function [Podospora comata]